MRSVLFFFLRKATLSGEKTRGFGDFFLGGLDGSVVVVVVVVRQVVSFGVGWVGLNCKIVLGAWQSKGSRLIYPPSDQQPNAPKRVHGPPPNANLIDGLFTAMIP